MSRVDRNPSRQARASREWAQANPDLWFEQTFGEKIWDMQREIFRSVWENRYTVCKSCYASGKSYIGAALVLTWAHLHKNCIVVTTAPSMRQVRLNVWQNIHMLHEKAQAPLGSQLLTTEMRLGPNWYAFGFSTDEPENIQGIHARSGKIFVLVDESAAVQGAIHERLKAIMTSEGAHRLDIGNPLDPSGAFFDFFSNPDYKKFTISAFDTPNLKEGREVYPGLVTRTWVEERRREWREDSPMWRSQVLGEFPDASEDSLIPMSWIIAAQERWHNEEVDPSLSPIYGMDISRGGRSETVIAPRVGLRVLPLKTFSDISTMEAVGELQNLPVGPGTMMYLDDIGVGGGPVDRAKELGLPVVGVNVATRPEDDPLEKESGKDGNRLFANKRAELYWKVREALDPEGVGPRMSLPPDDVLAGQLASIKRQFDSRGRIKIMSKEEMRKAGIKSPDRADALMLSFAHEVIFGAQAESLAIPVGVGESGWNEIEQLGGWGALL